MATQSTHLTVGKNKAAPPAAVHYFYLYVRVICAMYGLVAVPMTYDHPCNRNYSVLCACHAPV
jgi:hypothetical protein